MALSPESSNMECLYLRASCHHAIGQFREALKDYDAALDLELYSMDKFVLQCLAFYQKELALYAASKLDSEFRWFDIDGDNDPLFKGMSDNVLASIEDDDADDVDGENANLMLITMNIKMTVLKKMKIAKDIVNEI